MFYAYRNLHHISNIWSGNLDMGFFKFLGNFWWVFDNFFAYLSKICMNFWPIAAFTPYIKLYFWALHLICLGVLWVLVKCWFRYYSNSANKNLRIGHITRVWELIMIFHAFVLFSWFCPILHKNSCITHYGRIGGIRLKNQFLILYPYTLRN